MLSHDFSYDLPSELIAQYPAPQRDSSRMLCLQEEQITDTYFKKLPAYLRRGDLLVLNDTQVIPARLFVSKESGGRVEIMLERLLGESSLLVQLRASKSPKIGTVLKLDASHYFTVQNRQDDMFILAYHGQQALIDLFLRQGHMPLPPYIKRADENIDRDRYQTVFANVLGAVAAPTAGLHFTEELLHKLEAQGIGIARVVLHVGAGTFKPVQVDDISKHPMHNEYMCVSAETVDKINTTKKNNGRVLAVGTTVVRSLETAAQEGQLRPCAGDTSLFIYPGFRFKVVDLLLTNFHLPASTLLMLVCAFAGQENVMRAYLHAVQEKYRFYSYGDAMLLTKHV